MKPNSNPFSTMRPRPSIVPLRDPDRMEFEVVPDRVGVLEEENRALKLRLEALEMDVAILRETIRLYQPHQADFDLGDL